MYDRNQKRILVICLGLALLTLALYCRVIRCDFVYYDDNVYVTKNPQVQAGLSWAGVKWALKSTDASNWHPLTWISHMLDCQLFGLNPAAPHLINLLFHVANTLLLFYWLWRLTGAVWKSALVAALFAWHPLHVESVAWVSERKDVLSTFFFFLTLIAYQKSKVKGGRATKWGRLTLLFFVLALLAKPMVVTLPFVLLLVDFWSAESASNTPVLQLPWKTWILDKLPYFVLTVAACWATFVAQAKGGSVMTFQFVSFKGRVANSIVAYLRYLKKTFIPDHLAVFYPFPQSWPTLVLIAAILVLLVITVVAIRNMRTRPWFAFGWFWYLGILVPVIGLVQVGFQSIADRYMYVPSVGLFIILAWGLEEIVEHAKARSAAVAFSALALVACMVLTWRQIGTWKNSETLFKHDIQITGYNFIACSDLAAYYLDQKRSDEEIFYYEKAVEAAPDLPVAESDLGDALQKLGKTEQATPHLLRAKELEAQRNPHSPQLQEQIAFYLSKEHKSNEAMQHYQQAEKLYSEALRQNPNSPVLLNNLALLLATNPNEPVRNGPEAVALAQRGCELTQWKVPVLISTLAAAYAEAGRFDDAQNMANKARETALAAGQKEIASKNEELVKLYQAHKPYREQVD